MYDMKLNTKLFTVLSAIAVSCILIAGAQALKAAPPSPALSLAKNPDFVKVSGMPGLLIDLRYASKNNFMGVNLYGNFNKAWLHKTAATKLRRAVEILREEHPELRLMVLDALRPRSVQRQLFKKVRGTPQQKYVANPDKGSIHNYGFALDITLATAAQKELDMGTPFDDFRRLAQPRHEKEFLKKGLLSKKQVQNRLILRKVMTKAGFIQLPIEWWHYDALPGSRVRAKYKIIE